MRCCRKQLARRLCLLGIMLLGVCLARASIAFAQPGVTYPQVYGPTGTLYGPTQAHYQYQRQYGKPWYGPGPSAATGTAAYPHASQLSAVGHHHHHQQYHRHYGGYVHGPAPYPIYDYGYGYGYGYGGSSIDLRLGGVGGGIQFYHGPVGGGWGLGGYGYGAPGWGSSFPPSSIPAAPLVIQPHPFILGQDPFHNPVLREWMPQHGAGNDAVPARGGFVNPGQGNAGQVNPGQGNAGQRAPQQGGHVLDFPAPGAKGAAADRGEREAPLIVKPSNLEMKRASIRAQAQGDEYLVKQNFVQAYARYKQAMVNAADRAEPRFRMAFALVAMGRYELAAADIKRGLQLDPQWPWRGEGLLAIYGADNVVLKDSILHKVAAWVREDVRDPDRLFLMGVLLHFNEDRERALPFFRTVDTLASRPAYVQPFLKPPPPEVAQPPQPGVRQVGGERGDPAAARPAVEANDVFGNVPQGPGPTPEAKPVPRSQAVPIYPRGATPFRRPAEGAAVTPLPSSASRDPGPRPADATAGNGTSEKPSAATSPARPAAVNAPQPAPVNPPVEGPKLLLPGEAVPK